MRTDQENALNEIQVKFGPSSFTEDHLNYRRVGFRRGEATITAIGKTWVQAIERLGRKAK